uniref:Uncharacterized protein n=1 Tax=Latimeria chalumnae TaxID=7897 RepID=H3A7Z8_LATCH
MTRGAWMCRQNDDGLKIWFAPRENEKPFTDSERAQKWRLSLASLLFFTVLLSDHLWFCAEAKLIRTRDKRQGMLPLTNLGDHSSSTDHTLSFNVHSFQNSFNKDINAIFLGNSTKSLWRLETCHPHSSSGQCFSVEDAELVCRSMSGDTIEESTRLNFSDFYLSFCNSYSLSELFAGLSNPDSLNCSMDVTMDGDTAGCSQCIQAYQRYDQHAQEKYEEFEVLLQKYLQSDEYSVKACVEDCKVGLLIVLLAS